MLQLPTALILLEVAVLVAIARLEILHTLRNVVDFVLVFEPQSVTEL